MAHNGNMKPRRKGNSHAGSSLSPKMGGGVSTYRGMPSIAEGSVIPKGAFEQRGGKKSVKK